MSGVGDERWRNSRGQLPPQSQPNQRPKQGASRKGSYNNILQEKSGEQPDSVNAMASGNAWGNERNKGEARNATMDQQTTAAGFNARDTREFLKRRKAAGFWSQSYVQIANFMLAFASISSEDSKALRYKALAGPASTKTGGPWASKPNTMGSGKDFFLELRKQVSSLQQTERVGG
ncbi:hypothetical protein MMC32_003410 [Xylographa parallela]|nr:hypothetical protein [Xylographa parallela]